MRGRACSIEAWSEVVLRQHFVAPRPRPPFAGPEPTRITSGTYCGSLSLAHRSRSPAAGHPPVLAARLPSSQVPGRPPALLGGGARQSRFLRSLPRRQPSGNHAFVWRRSILGSRLFGENLFGPAQSRVGGGEADGRKGEDNSVQDLCL